jgi:hypothetical protein
MAAMSPHRSLIERLEALGVEHRPVPGRDDGFAGLFYRGKAFAHFHNDHELDIRLTRAVIERECLSHPKNSAVHPDRSTKSPWIEIRFATAKEIDDIVRLVRIAIAQL